MEPQHLDRPIRVVGRYALYGKLASGGMATVHFGRLLGPAGFSRTVAIKRLHPQFAKDPEFVAMFLDEARLAARIQHPNVVATVDVVAKAEELFLVMDYIRGESFSRLLRASRKKGIEVSLGILTSVLSGMLHGLHAAHEAKDEHGRPLSVVHRDVSPQNVLVGIDGVTRVLDFGVAKAAARVQVTRDGQMKGKLAYMAPEQLSGKPVDRRTDIFASGIVMWEALTARRLFDAEDAAEVLRMIVSEEIPPPSAVVPSIPRVIDDIVMKALSREPSARFQTAREFAIALEESASFSSTREVGEWVEKVAGETLLNREQAVAEIEAISAVSDVSSSSPAFMRPKSGRSVPPSRTPPPPPRLSSRAPPKPQDSDEEQTSVFDSSRPDAAEGGATRVQVPRPSYHGDQKLPIVPEVDAAMLGFGEDGEKTNVYEPSAGNFDDSNERTHILEPVRHGFEDSNATTNIYEPTKRPFTDDESAPTIVRSATPSERPSEPTRPRNQPPPPPSKRPPTVIVQDLTDPAMFRRIKPAPLSPAWFWRDPDHRLFRVAFGAGTVALFVSFGVVAAWGPRHVPPHHAELRESAVPEPSPMSVVAVAPEPAAPALAPSPPSVETTATPSAEVPPETTKTRAVVRRTVTRVAEEKSPVARPPSPATPVVAEEIDDPYAGSHGAAQSGAATAEKPPPPQAASDPPAIEKIPAGCRQPYFVDENGIRRIKPECL